LFQTRYRVICFAAFFSTNMKHRAFTFRYNRAFFPQRQQVVGGSQKRRPTTPPKNSTMIGRDPWTGRRQMQELPSANTGISLGRIPNLRPGKILEIVEIPFA
jgi:hypothetical protein